MTAADCAASVNLSPSRFLHLFKEQTGISFRAFRAWKRARHLLHFVNEDINLAHLAQDIGYPDSTHFSHSIRRFYGLQPRAIFPARGILRSTAAIPACATVPVSVRGGHSGGAGPTIARGRKKPDGAGRMIRQPAGEDLERQKADP